MRGVAAVELALVTPIFFLVTIGALELGRAVWTKHMLAQIAREAVRYASVRSISSDDPATAAKIAEKARSQVVGLDPQQVGVQVTWTPANQAGGNVRVTLSYQFHPVAGLLSLSSLQLSSQAAQTISY